MTAHINVAVCRLCTFNPAHNGKLNKKIYTEKKVQRYDNFPGI